MIVLVEVRLPNHYLVVLASRGEVIAAFRERNCQSSSLKIAIILIYENLLSYYWARNWIESYLMSMKRVQYFSLEEIENLQSQVIRCRNQVVARWMKRHRVNRLRVARIVLYESIGPDVPYFDAGIGACRRYELPARMKRHTVHIARVLVERMNAVLRRAVPQLDCFVLWGADDHARVLGEFGASHPVRVLVERKLEFLSMQRPHFDGLVVRRGQYELAVRGEVNRANRGRVCRENGRFSFATMSRIGLCLLKQYLLVSF